MPRLDTERRTTLFHLSFGPHFASISLALDEGDPAKASMSNQGARFSHGTMARVRAKSAHHCSCVSSITSIATSASRQASCAPRDSPPERTLLFLMPIFYAEIRAQSCCTYVEAEAVQRLVVWGLVPAEPLTARQTTYGIADCQRDRHPLARDP